MSRGYKLIHEDKILQALIDDPTISVREMSKELDSYRQKVWRRKKLVLLMKVN